MKYLATNWSNSRGSIGGTTYSQNRSGLYTKNRTKPTYPKTPAQANSNAAFIACTTGWASMLSQTQRNGWTLYGQTNPVTNTLGQSIILSGLQIFCRVNIPLFIAGSYAAMQLTSPGSVTLLTPLTVNSATTVDKGTTLGGTGNVDFTVNFPGTMYGTDYVFFYITKPCSAGRTPVHQPQLFVYTGLLSGLGTPATTMTFTLADAFPLDRASGTPWYIKGYWIRDANLASYNYLQGSTL